MNLRIIASFAVLFLCPLRLLAASSRTIPKPLASHPGRIFLRGEVVDVRLPEARPWVVRDYDGKAIAEGSAGRLELRGLPVGFYEIVRSGQSNALSFAVLEPLKAPTPINSPVGLDVAMAWFYQADRMGQAASLSALAGVNWVRDRLNWGEMEPRRGEFVPSNKYDASARAQSSAGLRVLQVIHYSPPWANPNGKRFPLDLRDAYHFFEAMATRWQGQVQAFEPWNEADIPMFGGHTGSEMAALQKAAYFGLKAGNPEIIACLNVFALHNSNQLADLDENEAFPYFDTYNLHHYERFENFPKLYADHRFVSAGRPLWVSECALPVKWSGDEKLKEPSVADLKVQSERVAKTFACSLHEGSAATFYFLLPHYVEGQTQFGIIRPDLSPRPAYVALAAVGRLLPDARALGKLAAPDSSIQAYLFQAKPDGQNANVLVVWTTNQSAILELSGKPKALFDDLGRPIRPQAKITLSSAPLFVLLPPGSTKGLDLIPPPKSPPRLLKAVSHVVMQSLWPETNLNLAKSACVLESGKEERIPIFLYNFGSRPLRGDLSVAPAPGIEAALSGPVELQPMERLEKSLPVRITPGTHNGNIRLTADFGEGVQSVLSLRVMSKPK